MRKNGVTWVGLALVLLTAGFYAAVLGNDFVNYDDPDYVTQNSHVRAGLTTGNVRWALTTGEASNWHPLTWLAHCLDWQLFGERPWGHHAMSVLLHGINVALVLLVWWRLTGAWWPSALLAAVFAWHPVQVESVAWVAERKNVLSTLFWLLTTWFYAGYVRAPAGRGRRDYFLALGCFALGLMAKPMLVTLPFTLWLLDFWPLGRTPWWSAIAAPAPEAGKPVAKPATRKPLPPVPSEAQPTGGVSWRLLLLEKVPFLALAFGSAAATFYVQRAGGAVSSLGSLSLGARVANALVAYPRYVGKLFWPVDLAVLYPHPGHWPPLAVSAAVVFLVLVTAGVGWQWRRRPWLPVGWCWFLGTLVPVIGLVQVGVQSMADRYLYVPCLGVWLMLFWSAREWVARRPATGRILAGVAGVALGACVVLTERQIRFWRNSLDLFTHTVAVTRDNYLAYNNLGYFYDHAGKLDAALENYRRSTAINPNYDEAQNNLGYALAEQGHYAEAVPYYEAALRIKPNLAEAHNNLGNALADLGRPAEAIAHYQAALRVKPEHADAHANYGIALAMQGKLDAAVAELREAVRLDPRKPSGHSNLGNALALLHQADAAIREYQAALELAPDDARSHNNLGNVLAEQGRLEEAGGHYATALRVKADNPEAEFNYAAVLLRLNKRDEAAAHLRAVLRLNPAHAAARQQLAALTGGVP